MKNLGIAKHERKYEKNALKCEILFFLRFVKKYSVFYEHKKLMVNEH